MCSFPPPRGDSFVNCYCHGHLIAYLGFVWKAVKFFKHWSILTPCLSHGRFICWRTSLLTNGDAISMRPHFQCVLHMEIKLKQTNQCLLWCCFWNVIVSTKAFSLLRNCVCGPELCRSVAMHSKMQIIVGTFENVNVECSPSYGVGAFSIKAHNVFLIEPHNWGLIFVLVDNYMKFVTKRRYWLTQCWKFQQLLSSRNNIAFKHKKRAIAKTAFDLFAMVVARKLKAKQI